jgi:DNA-binding transcriptional regulator YiaG
MQRVTDESSWTTEAESRGTSSVSSQLLDNFRASKEYRHAFVEEQVANAIAAQIKSIREQRKIPRPEFARMLGKAPSWVFRLEDPNEPPPTVSTLLQVAKAYDALAPWADTNS